MSVRSAPAGLDEARGRSAVLLVLDDLQGCDAAVLCWLTQLACRIRQAGPARLVLLAAVREGEPLAYSEPFADPGDPGDPGDPADLAGHSRRSSLDIRCFGGFRLSRGAVDLDCGAVRPKVRSLLRLLAIHADRPVHRELLLDALWPDLDVPAGIRNLQVAVSQLRAFLEPDDGRHGGRLRLRRDEESYRLALLPGDRCDVREFEHAVRAWRQIRATGTDEAVVEALRVARTWYAGDLLPEVGPMEWAVAERLRLRALACDVMGALAEAELSLGRADAASEAARSSLELDAYRDASWRVLIAAYQEAGSLAAASRVRLEYEQVLRNLEA